MRIVARQSLHDRITADEFRRRCLKPHSDRLGTWTAQRLARPAALRITWIVAPWGVTAHQATLAAGLVALAAAAAFCDGSPVAWLIGAAFLELWYVVDHVDGQLARWRGTASLDGTALDYLMHHGLNFAIPLALAYGIARQTGRLEWMLLGIAWSGGVILLGLRHDVRYKAFIQRLKLVEGKLDVVGGGGGRPVATMWPRNVRGIAAWSVFKLHETHALAHLLLVVSGFRLFAPTIDSAVVLTATLLPALTALPAALFLIVRDLRRGEAESQFMQWYRVPDGETLHFRDGWWVVERSSS